MLVCPACDKEIKTGGRCYQVRVGNIEEDGDTFLVDEDVAYYHENCLPEGVGV